MKASRLKNGRSKQYLGQIFEIVMGKTEGYTLVYAYYLSKGILVKKAHNFMVAFNENKKECLIVPMTSSGEVRGQKIILTTENIVNIKKNILGKLKIESTLFDKPMNLIVPRVVLDRQEKAYLLPINQEEEAIQFMQFMTKLNNQSHNHASTLANK